MRRSLALYPAPVVRGACGAVALWRNLALWSDSAGTKGRRVSQTAPERARAVVIGGGVTGTSVAYHLAKLGWTDVVLLERQQFASGTSWHAAGLIGTARPSDTHAELCAYTRNLLPELEEETGQSTGFRQVGSVAIAHSRDRFAELKRLADSYNAFGFGRMEVITAEEVGHFHPLVRTDDLLGGTWLEIDGMASPVDVVNAYVKGARGRGVQCIENVEVTAIRSANGKVTGVETTAGNVACEFVVCAAGLWSRHLGRLAGVTIPLHACEHYYAHTEKLEDLPSDLPVLRDQDKCAYYREDAGSLLVGAFEPVARPIRLDAIPADFCFDQLPGHMEDQLMPVLEDAMDRVPLLREVGWRSFFCGPESFTHDDQFHVGEAPELGNFFVACGLNSVGIVTSGGIGKVCAEWMDKGHSPVDLTGNDLRRVFVFQGAQAYIEDRVSETLGLLYARHYPYRQYATARDVRHSPVHERLAARGACFGEAGGWERPNWFAPNGVEPRYEYQFGRQNWFEHSAAEHRAAREGVALFDQSSFSKYVVKGRDACAALQHICSNDIDIDPGRLVYTHWLNERGGIEAELTVTRIAENEFFVVSGAGATRRDLGWLERHIDDAAHAAVVDVSALWAVFGMMGPKSRSFAGGLTGEDLSAEALPFGAVRDVELGCAIGRAVRVSYVGELGFEFYVPVDQARHAFDRMMEAGEAHGLVLAGMHALDSCRIEKKFVHYGHDVADVDTPVEAGMRWVCKMNKAVSFIGHDAIARQIDSNRSPPKRLLQLLLERPEPLLFGHEPMLRDGESVGYLTSGNYGHTLGGGVGLGYARCDDGVTRDWVESGKWEVLVEGERVPAKASLGALYDPKGVRARG